MSPSHPSSPFAAVLRVLRTPQILLMVAKVYIPVLFPLTFLIALLSLRLDVALGMASFVPVPVNFVLAAVSLVSGLAIVGVSYAELVFVGAGSPSPTAGRTLHLVRSGIYAYSRNPSVIGKLLGVLAVGFLLNSFSFCFILVPTLLAGSLVEKVWRQEPVLIEIFGAEYEQYRAEVPLFLPWKFFSRRR
ncbi:MAG: isoprenylcysteine carboxylmethyltransferase family protein [Myxococcales bacterium]|nr:isoprenylcysteine carboxylmethyltransferase family protein [Myxococcales bacterium]